MEWSSKSMVGQVFFDTPVISIVMPLFNKADQVLDTISSVQAQLVSNWELIVVDDGSTDGGAELLKKLEDPRIKVYSQQNTGVSAARNQGIAYARSELIAFLDADDIWKPNFLATILAMQADFSEASWYATSYEIKPFQGYVHKLRLSGLREEFKRGLLKNYFVVASRSDPPVCSSAVAVKRSAIRAIGGFPLGIGSGEDLLTWARLAIQFPLAYDTSVQAVFVTSGIDRSPDPKKRVGAALEALLCEHSEVAGFRQYLGLWYRMQAIMALRFSQGFFAFRCALLAVRYAPTNIRNFYILLLSCMPFGSWKILDTVLRRLGGK